MGCLGIVAALNVWYDPVNSFHFIETGVMRLLLEGKNVAVPDNYNERLLVKNYIKSLPSSKSLVALGSSRILQLSGDFFLGQTFYNFGVSGGTLHDDLAIYQLLRQANKRPKYLIIGLDPWTLCQNGQIRWRTLEREFRAISLEMGSQYDLTSTRANSIFDFPGQVISIQYFWISLGKLVRREGRASFYATTATNLSIPIKTSDGVLEYPLKSRLRSESEVEELADSYVMDPGYSLGNFKIEPDAAQTLGLFVELAMKEGVQIIFFLSPFHPQSYSRIVEKYPIVNQAEEMYTGIAFEKKLILLGSFDPAKSACLSSEFYDGMHPKPICLKKVVKKMEDDLPLKVSWALRGWNSSDFSLS